MFQHSTAVLFFSMLFQYSFAKYFLIFIFIFVEASRVFLANCTFWFYFGVNMFLIMITVIHWFVYFDIVHLFIF